MYALKTISPRTSSSQQTDIDKYYGIIQIRDRVGSIYINFVDPFIQIIKSTKNYENEH